MAPALKSLLKSKNKQNEDTTWVLEGIVGFLRSPTWNVPVMNFFDEHCSCFESKEENKLEYTDIHMKYKALVENLLSSYINELSISVDLFAQACNQHTSAINGVEGMFAHIWAADDFLLFKQLMIKHNLELEMQTLSLFQTDSFGSAQGTGDIPPCNPKYMNAASTSKDATSSHLLDFEDKNQSNMWKDIINESQGEYAAALMRANQLEEKEAEDLRRAIQYSKLEMERINAQAEEEKRMLEEAIRQSLSCSTPAFEIDSAAFSTQSTKIIPSTEISPSVQGPKNGSDVTATKAVAAVTLSSESSTKKSLTKPKSPNTYDLPPLRQKTNAEAALDWINSAQKENTVTQSSSSNSQTTEKLPELSLSTKPEGIDPADLAERKLYLKQQREKLLELKKKKREEELKHYQDVSVETPVSSKSNAQSQSADVSNDNPDKVISARRALAERLKREVIQRKH